MTRMLSDDELNNTPMSEGTRRILSLLGVLRGDAEGQLLFDVIAQLLVEQDRQTQEKESRFAFLIDAILQSSSEGDGNAQPLQILRTLGHELPETIAATLFNAPPGAKPNLAAATRIPIAGMSLPTADVGPEPPPDAAPSPAQEPSPAPPSSADPGDDQQAPETTSPAAEPADVNAIAAKLEWDDTPEARQSEQTSGELSRLRELLVSRMSDTSAQYKDFSGILNTLLTDLQNAKSAEQLEALRNILKRKVRRMIKEHKSLSDNISMSSSEIQKFENKCQQLNRELGEAKQMSLTDELTGLPNRRAFLRRLANETGRVQRYGYPLAVAMLDLDLFKEINDTHGHETGDLVLQNYTEQVLSTFRNYDMVARYGGEEFAVLLPHTDGKGAERALNKVRKRATESTFSSNNQSHTLPTFSAGIAIYHPGEPPSALIDRADRAMYEAKRHGRNRVELLVD